MFPEACQAILAAGVGPEQICQPASEVEEEKVQESKRELIDILRSKTFSLEGCEAQSVEKALKSAKKELEHKKEELKTQKEKLKAQRQKQQELQRSRRLKAASEESASSDEDGWVKIEEDLQDRICELSDEKEACEGRIQALEEDLKKLKEDFSAKKRPVSGSVLSTLCACIVWVLPTKKGGAPQHATS